jgi:hypothetical protein
VWWCAHRSKAFSCFGARELTGEGGKERGEHGDPMSGLTKARVMVWRLGEGGEAVVGRELGGSSAQHGEGEKGTGRTGGGGSIL